MSEEIKTAIEEENMEATVDFASAYCIGAGLGVISAVAFVFGIKIIDLWRTIRY